MNATLDARIARCIEDELATLKQFLDVLQGEQHALTEGDVDRLMPLITDKTRLAGLLAQITDQRGELLITAGLSPDRDGLERWFDQYLPSTELAQSLRADWVNLLELAGKARALNETNGNLIATRLQHNQQALNALLAAANQAALYGPDGQTRASPGGRLFGAA